MNQINLTTHLSARLQHLAVGGRLLSHYADQARATGTATTAEDARAAWCQWLASQGATERPLTGEDCSYHERVAAVLREVARYEVEAV